MFDIVMAAIAGIGSYIALTNKRNRAVLVTKSSNPITQKTENNKKPAPATLSTEESINIETEKFISSKSVVARELRQCITVNSVRIRLVSSMKRKNPNLSYDECARKVIDEFHKDRSYYSA